METPIKHFFSSNSPYIGILGINIFRMIYFPYAGYESYHGALMDRTIGTAGVGKLPYDGQVDRIPGLIMLAYTGIQRPICIF